MFFITFLVVILTSLCVAGMFYQLSQQPRMSLSFVLNIKLIISGIVAFIADTVGMGSFAVNIALAKLLGTFSDEELPALNNGAQVLPGALESLFFIQAVSVDWMTLITLVTGTCIGGLIGGMVVSRLSKQAIRLAMIACFFGMICLLLADRFHWLAMTGNLTALHSWKLGLGFIGMIICGGLTSVGVGLFAMVQGVLFLLDTSPLIAFPIMMTAGALQQPLTTLVFLQQKKIPLKKTLILSMAGCLGVLITVPLVRHLTVAWLHGLLLCIFIYNLITMSQSYWRMRQAVPSFMSPENAVEA